MHKKCTRFYRFLLFSPVSIENSHFWCMWMMLNHMKTNSTKLAHHRLKIRKVIEFFQFQSLTQHPLFWSRRSLGRSVYFFSPLGFDVQRNSDHKTQNKTQNIKLYSVSAFKRYLNERKSDTWSSNGNDFKI